MGVCARIHMHTNTIICLTHPYAHACSLSRSAWVIAHECGHGAFSDNKTLQDTVGYILHTALLVPYFSWQRSHAVHHSKTNHVTEGETHVPYVKGEVKGDLNLNARKIWY